MDAKDLRPLPVDVRPLPVDFIMFADALTDARVVDCTPLPVDLRPLPVDFIILLDVLRDALVVDCTPRPVDFTAFIDVDVILLHINAIESTTAKTTSSTNVRISYPKSANNVVVARSLEIVKAKEAARTDETIFETPEDEEDTILDRIENK